MQYDEVAESLIALSSPSERWRVLRRADRANLRLVVSIAKYMNRVQFLDLIQGNIGLMKGVDNSVRRGSSSAPTQRGGRQAIRAIADRRNHPCPGAYDRDDQ